MSASRDLTSFMSSSAQPSEVERNAHTTLCTPPQYRRAVSSVEQSLPRPVFPTTRTASTASHGSIWGEETVTKMRASPPDQLQDLPSGPRLQRPVEEPPLYLARMCGRHQDSRNGSGPAVSSAERQSRQDVPPSRIPVAKRGALNHNAVDSWKRTIVDDHVQCSTDADRRGEINRLVAHVRGIVERIEALEARNERPQKSRTECRAVCTGECKKRHQHQACGELESCPSWHSQSSCSQVAARKSHRVLRSAPTSKLPQERARLDHVPLLEPSQYLASSINSRTGSTSNSSLRTSASITYHIHAASQETLEEDTTMASRDSRSSSIDTTASLRLSVIVGTAQSVAMVHPGSPQVAVLTPPTQPDCQSFEWATSMEDQADEEYSIFSSYVDDASNEGISEDDRDTVWQSSGSSPSEESFSSYTSVCTSEIQGKKHEQAPVVRLSHAQSRDIATTLLGRPQRRSRPLGAIFAPMTESLNSGAVATTTIRKTSDCFPMYRPPAHSNRRKPYSKPASLGSLPTLREVSGVQPPIDLPPSAGQGDSHTMDSGSQKVPVAAYDERLLSTTTAAIPSPSATSKPGQQKGPRAWIRKLSRKRSRTIL